VTAFLPSQASERTTGAPCLRYRIIQLLFVTLCNRNLYHAYSSQPSHADAVIDVLKFHVIYYSIRPSNKFTLSQMRVAGSLLNEKKKGTRISGCKAQLQSDDTEICQFRSEQGCCRRMRFFLVERRTLSDIPPVGKPDCIHV
jgi:hypothetical protein